MSREIKNKKKKIGNGLYNKNCQDNKYWNPNIFYVMINKNISEKVYQYQDIGNNQRTYFNPSHLIIVQTDITSTNIWDTILFIGGRYSKENGLHQNYQLFNALTKKL